MTGIAERSQSPRLVAALGVVLAAFLAAHETAMAQDRPPGPERGTHLDGFLGAGTSDAHTGPVLAGIVGWRLVPGAAAEVRGSWLARGTGASAFHADVGGIFNVLNRERVRPFVGAGFGLYRATFDSSASPMSGFYRGRLRQGIVGDPSQSFVDPAFRLSAGVDWRVHDRISVRPKVSGVFVRRGGRGESVAMVGCRIGYRFEDRPVTP
ncbi:MAG: hypothetical protein FJW27_14400 [Acidimicrobiia bacterium]|nr:hypothetical protein [Acidimicrobiia bacterium]